MMRCDSNLSRSCLTWLDVFISLEVRVEAHDEHCWYIKGVAQLFPAAVNEGFAFLGFRFTAVGHQSGEASDLFCLNLLISSREVRIIATEIFPNLVLGTGFRFFALFTGAVALVQY
jgi:hypothetical protein